MTFTLQTDRLVLRPFCSADSPWVAEALQDVDVAQWIPLLPYPYGIDDGRAFVELQAGPQADALAVIHGETPVGCITKATELGYWFHKSAWGQGFATEAARAVVAHHFNSADARMTSGYMIDNSRSQRVLSKLGFTPTETVERLSTAVGEMRTIQRMELSRANWVTHA
ncbi:GCN5-related N-acetyltransferase [Sulfitobacter noctilucicola]|uniref:RimJ/RimL family protein N-acetyltransferase n=1 Tax=Sulfitobacter noctilucicola TaxID=1342301 RepID=A0A7W6M7C4_9RHOB|nr:GNAT family N-acetyltransferase [Sulfitobacter noctilucicola]KIN65043.1 GCN5-related N-acetyltransferase [Sulfitobacter noctilucicola]MBB4173818.1 RimJ/RimL family protein N-acetyltransferase [Sulfitobacter noctilucicola]